MSDKEALDQVKEKLHTEACDRNEDHYVDPETNFWVFTRVAHLKRGFCCKSGCRHCPWSYRETKPEN
ncbi:MAG: hypothetical protein KDD53_08890 [Bdellovibrionales bacterium]|nr:hypothetical protein [Bdellovibrionales bacterium]